MRTYFPPNYEQQSTPIDKVVLSTHTRHEIVLILIALQMLYTKPDILNKLLQAIEQDVNRFTTSQRGRPGLSYWEILVLLAVRLGCDLDYDQLNDLAENHRNLQRILGVHDNPIDPNDAGYKWQRIRDNLCLISEETIQLINDLIVKVGNDLKPGAINNVRGDNFVVDTNIHYPTDSSLIGDGLRKLLDLVERLEDLICITWNPTVWKKKVKQALRAIGYASRSRKADANEQRKQCYRHLYSMADKIMERCMEIAGKLEALPGSESVGVLKELNGYLTLTMLVRDYSSQRVLEGKMIPADAKIFSMFETHTRLINRGKQPDPNQFGRNLLIVEDAAGFIIYYRVFERNELEKDIIVEEMKKLKEKYGGRIKCVSYDKGHHSPEIQEELKNLFEEVVIPKPGVNQAREQESEASDQFRNARRRHSGVESAIGALQRGNGMKRCRDKSERGFRRYVGIGILGRTLHTLGKLVVQARDPKSLAAYSKRKET